MVVGSPSGARVSIRGMKVLLQMFWAVRPSLQEHNGLCHAASLAGG